MVVEVGDVVVRLGVVRLALLQSLDAGDGFDERFDRNSDSANDQS